MGTALNMMKAVLLVASVVALASAAPLAGKCCTSCEAPLEKYYSIDKIHNMCGECCMNPKDYWKYKIFEHGLTNSTDNNPCADSKFTNYDSTVTHGFGPVKMTLDLYKPTSEAVQDDMTTLYTLQTPPDCAETQIPSKYAKQAMAFDKQLKVGTCKSVGYTVPDGTTTRTVPVLGKLTVNKYKKPSQTLIVGDAPVGIFCGSVPFIISMNMTVHTDGTFDYNNDIKIKRQTVSCLGEKFKWDEASKSFDISGALADPSDCLAKAISQDPKAKPTLTYDGTNIVAKNGYGTLKLKPSSGNC